MSYREQSPPANAYSVLLISIIGIVIVSITRYFAPTEWANLLYLVPLFAVANGLGLIPIILAGLACAILRIAIPFAGWDPELFAQFLTGLLAFTAPGLLLYRWRMDKLLALEHAAQLKNAQEEARMLVESSPSAAITVAGDGRILLANQAARTLLGLRLEDNGKPDLITEAVPFLQQVLHSPANVSLVRTHVEGSGRNRDGQPFYVQAWVSSYVAGDGRRFAILFSDASENGRNLEETGLRQLLSSSQILAGAVSQEVCNISTAALALHRKLNETSKLSENTDFTALGTLIQSLSHVTSTEPPSFEEQAAGVDVSRLLDELRTILAGSVGDDGIELIWEVNEGLPRVRAERNGLTQVLLNVFQNARGRVKGHRNAAVRVTSYVLEKNLIISVTECGPSATDLERTPQLFQPSADSRGLGLYVSRAIIRTFGGELVYDHRPTGGCFLVHLPALLN